MYAFRESCSQGDIGENNLLIVLNVNVDRLLCVRKAPALRRQERQPVYLQSASA